MNSAENAVIEAFGERTSQPVQVIRAAAEAQESIKAVATALRSLERKNVIAYDGTSVYTLYREQIAIAEATHPQLEPLDDDYEEYGPDEWA